jgi:hypothetical protein
VPADKPVYIGGVNTSGSAMIADRVRDFALLNQKMYYHPQAVGNILSFSNVKTKLELKYINDTFVAGTPDGDVVFRPHGKLYVYSVRGDVITGFGNYMFSWLFGHNCDRSHFFRFFPLFSGFYKNFIFCEIYQHLRSLTFAYYFNLLFLFLLLL